MRKANNFQKMAFSMEMSYFCTHFVSLCCYNLFITIFTVVITHTGSFILYLMPYTLRHRMTKPTKWPVCPAKSQSQISLGIRPAWSWRTKHLLVRTAKALIRLRECFAGCTCNIVGFVMWQLIFVLISHKLQTFHCTSDNFSVVIYIR